MDTLKLIVIWCYINLKLTKFGSVAILLLFSFLFFEGLNVINTAWNLKCVESIVNSYIWTAIFFGYNLNSLQLFIVGFVFTIVGFFGTILSTHLVTRKIRG
jgi:hypothetical protein